MTTSYDACRANANAYDACRIDAKSYDAWLTSVDTEVEEYNRYWEAYFEKAEELFQDGEYSDEFIDFLESGDWSKRYDDLRQEFIKRKAMRLEKTDSLIAADILTERAATDHD